jgi:hypothetical protein
VSHAPVDDLQRDIGRDARRGSSAQRRHYQNSNDQSPKHRLRLQMADVAQPIT